LMIRFLQGRQGWASPAAEKGLVKGGQQHLQEVLDRLRVLGLVSPGRFANYVQLVRGRHPGESEARVIDGLPPFPGVPRPENAKAFRRHGVALAERARPELRRRRG